ncbi:hypothetical protein EDC01DRAFT_776059 [Geopyxis carbonaria]|nr:hypothetical protein EDC01DRAFT_776059 [Geopyxis carbonaria]
MLVFNLIPLTLLALVNLSSGAVISTGSETDVFDPSTGGPLIDTEGWITIDQSLMEQIAAEHGLSLDDARSGDETAARASYKCHTSAASPTNDELSGLAAWFSRLSLFKTCVQQNPNKSMCTRMGYYNGAAATICGDPYFYVMCREVTRYIYLIKGSCQGSGGAAGKAGGIVNLGGANWIAVH